MSTQDETSKFISDDDKICRYLQGNMSESEEMEFIEALKADNELRQNAVIQARLIKGMKDADIELINAFKDTDAMEIDICVNRPVAANILAASITPIKRKLSLSKWLSIAATVAILIVGGYKGYDYYETTRLGMQYANAFPISSITRGDSNSSIEAELTILFNNVVERKDLKSTTARLDELWNISQQDIYNDYTDYGPHIGWYLVIGYLEDYNKTKAKDILNQLILLYPVGTSLGNNVSNLINKL